MKYSTIACFLAASLINDTSAATCKYKINVYENGDCSGTPSTMFDKYYEGFEENPTVPIGYSARPLKLCDVYSYEPGQCYNVISPMCDANSLVYTLITKASDSRSTPDEGFYANYFAPGGVWGFSATQCVKLTYIFATYSIKLSEVEVKGNMFGVSYFDGIGILFCSAFLFGLC